MFRSREQNGKEEGGKLFTVADGGPLSEPAEPSVSARFSHHYQKERKRGRREQEGGGWRQRVVRMTKVRHF